MVAILPLTRELARTFDAQATEAYVGDRSCSFENMRMSCFASEGCNMTGRCSVSTGLLASFLKAHTALVAVDDAHEVLLGYVCVDLCAMSSTIRIKYPFTAFEPGAGIAYNLCVATHARGHGLVRQFMQRLATTYTVVYVMINLPSTAASRTVREHMLTRVDGLRSLYEHLDFRRVPGQTADNYELMRWVPGGA